MKKQELWFDDNFKNHTIYLPALTRNLKSKFIMSIFPELRFMLSFISWGTIVRDSNYCQSDILQAELELVQNLTGT